MLRVDNLATPRTSGRILRHVTDERSLHSVSSFPRQENEWVDNGGNPHRSHASAVWCFASFPPSQPPRVLSGQFANALRSQR